MACFVAVPGTRRSSPRQRQRLQTGAAGEGRVVLGEKRIRRLMAGGVGGVGGGVRMADVPSSPSANGPGRGAASSSSSASGQAAGTESSATTTTTTTTSQRSRWTRPSGASDTNTSRSPPATSSASPDSSERRWPSARQVGSMVALAAAAVGAVVAIGDSLNSLSVRNLNDLVAWFDSLGPTAVFYYALVYYVLELVAFPALVLTVGAGYLFGVVQGAAVVSVAATAAAATSFLVSRYLFRDWVQQNVAERFPRFRAIDRAIAREGFKIVLLLRLSPLLPFAASNYLYGLTSVGFVPYALASWLGMLPGTLAYVYGGHAGSAVLETVQRRGEDGSGGGVNAALLAMGLVATAAVLTIVARTANQAVLEMEGEAMAATSNANQAAAEKDRTDEGGESPAAPHPRPHHRDL